MMGTSHLIAQTISLILASSWSHYKITPLDEWITPKFRSDRRCRVSTENGILTAYIISCGELCHSIISYSCWNDVKKVKIMIEGREFVRKTEKRLGKRVIKPFLLSAPEGLTLSIDERELVIPNCASNRFIPPQVIALTGAPSEKPLVKPLFVGQDVIFVVSGVDVQVGCGDRWIKTNHSLIALKNDCAIRWKGKDYQPSRFVKDLRVLRAR